MTLLLNFQQKSLIHESRNCLLINWEKTHSKNKRRKKKRKPNPTKTRPQTQSHPQDKECFLPHLTVCPTLLFLEGQTPTRANTDAVGHPHTQSKEQAETAATALPRQPLCNPALPFLSLCFLYPRSPSSRINFITQP